MNCEAVKWKITTRGFTLEEVLIMVAMNPFASGFDSTAVLDGLLGKPSVHAWSWNLSHEDVIGEVSFAKGGTVVRMRNFLSFEMVRLTKRGSNQCCGS
jgi:hypothetical protein